MRSAEEALDPKQLTNRRPLLAILVALASGIAMDRYVAIPMGVWCLAGLCFLLVWWFSRKSITTSTAALLLLLATTAVGGSWHHLHWYLFNATDIGRYAGAFPKRVAVEVETVGPIKYLPRPKNNPLWTMPTGNRSRVEVRVLAIRDHRQWKHASGKAMLLVDGRLPDVAPGTQFEVFGRILRPPPANNRGEFDFAAYRRMQRQHCVLRTSHPECLRITGTVTNWNPANWFAKLRTSGSRLLWGYLDHQRAGLAAAVLLGEREQLEHDRTEAFIKTGTIHLLAISGLHIGILVGFLFILLRFAALPRGLLLLGIALLTVFYALLTDARPPVMRAAVLVVVFCSALHLARQTNPLNALCLAALIVLAWNPSNLFRVGSQLSFLAVATLIFLEPVYQKIRQRQRDPLRQHIAQARPWPIRCLWHVWQWFWQLTLAGLAIFLMALPLVMLHFHLFTPVGVLLTPLLYLPLALALASGLGILLTGWLFPPLATLFAKLCDVNLGLLEWAVTAASRMPGGYAYMAGPTLWWTVVFYLGFALWALFPRWRPRPSRSCALLALWILVGIFSESHPRHKDALRCTFIDVGQGLSVLLELPDDSAILYDAGRMGSPSAAVRAISTTLWSCGRTHLDAVIISHADADHFNAIPELLERFSVGVIYLTPPMLRKRDEATRTLLAAIKKKGVSIRPLSGGQTLDAFNLHFRVLHPTRIGIESTSHGSVDNANSLVLLVECHNKRILLTGDLESAGLDAVLANPGIACDLILAPHHGSRNSRPHDVARWCRPSWTVISSGLRAPGPTVQKAYTGPGQTLLHTGSCGAVEATVSPSGLQIECQHPENR